MSEKVLLAWSSGKDSAFALHVLRGTEGVEVVGLLTTVNQAFDRVAMHAVRRTLLEAGVPAEQIELAAICTRCRAETYFSHRANGYPAGRFSAAIGLR